MRIIRFSVAAALAVIAFGASPAHAAKTQTATIALPAADLGTWIGAGYGNFIPVDDLSAIRQDCPAPGPLDGLVFKFFDLKGGFTKFKASGPPVLFGQNTPAGNVNDYDVDLYLFDKQCKRIEISGSNAGGATEKQSTRKPAYYAVIVYWQGHQPEMPVTLEYS